MLLRGYFFAYIKIIAYICKKTKMVAVITGDIVKSRKVPSTYWMDTLKYTLKEIGGSSKYWEIYRGDSFQVEVKKELGFESAIKLKSNIKKINRLDVRTAIGIGIKTFEGEKVSESNGSAFQYSGECYENLKKQTLAIKTDSEEIDETLNLMFELSSYIFRNWTVTVSNIITEALKHPKATQEELAANLKIKQSNVSRGLKRGGYDEIIKLNNYYKKIVSSL